MAFSRLHSSIPRVLGRSCFRNTRAGRSFKQQSCGITTSARSNGRWKPAVGIAFGTVFAGALLYYEGTGNSIKLDGPALAQVDEATKRDTSVNETSPMRLRMEQLIKEHQKKIVDEISRIDGKEFVVDSWSRPDGGMGTSCVLQDGNVFEKAGVNVSIVYGKLPRPAIEKMRADHKSFVAADVDSLDFFASGLSIVMHPKNPMAPTVHLNYRYFETADPNDPINGKKNWWFGGGTDLTPFYLFPEDCTHFHKTIKDTCDKHNPEYYPKFKKWCDEYFYLPHRREARGVGGIFFDDLDEESLKSSSSSSQAQSENPQEDIFSFVSDGLASFLPSYVPILERRKDMPFTAAQKDWQQLRRGRYVEFNLVHDRGTSFGLRTPSARIESILMSLPQTAKWVYMDPISGTRTGKEVPPDAEEADAMGKSREYELMEVLRNPRDWV